MSQNSLVSIIISTYNNKKTISRCLASIQKQSYKRIELIVVDEWSTDGTQKIAKKFGATVYFYGKERANNRNFGIKKAKGDFYFIVDSDMELEKNVVKECVAVCNTGKVGALVIPEKSVGIGYWAQVRAFERQFSIGDPLKGDNTVEAARFFVKVLIKKIGSYDPEMVGAEDWDLHQRILKNGYKVGRIQSFIIHNEGSINLKRLLWKKAYYGKAFWMYKNRYPKAFQKSIIRTSLLRNWYKNPKYGFGAILLKLLEGVALLYGMIMYRLGISVQHY